MFIQFTVLEFEHTTFGTRVSSHNHYTRAEGFNDFTVAILLDCEQEEERKVGNEKQKK